MTLADEVAAGPPEPRAAGTRSKTDAWLDTLTETDRAAALAVLNDLSWQHTQAADLFKRHGLTITGGSLGKWRRDHGITG